MVSVDAVSESLQKVLTRALTTPAAPLTPQESAALLAEIAEREASLPGRRTALLEAQARRALRVVQGEWRASHEWEADDRKLQELDQARRLLAQARDEVTRLHGAWTPEAQARPDALAALRRHFDELVAEVRGSVTTLKTFQIPPRPKVQRFEAAARELRRLNAEMLELTHDSHTFTAGLTAEQWFGSTCHILQYLRGVTGPPPQYPWQGLLDVARGVTRETVAA